MIPHDETGAETLLQIGPYLIDRKLGSGGMAHVWHGVHVEHGVDVALKVLHRTFSSDSGDHQFRREVAAVAMLDHPGIIRILDFGAVDDVTADSVSLFPEGAPYLVVEYADAGSLHGRMQQPGFGWEETRDVVLQVLGALGHAHARGLVHRDLKPDNLLGFRDGRWKLADFGIATLLAASDETEANPHGTPWYMAPEQLRGRLSDTGPWTDLYALGCMVYQLVTGAPPFTGASTLVIAQRHIMEEPAPLVPRFAVPDGVAEWVARLLRKAPMSRFQRAADAAAALERLGAAGPSATLPMHALPAVTQPGTTSDPTVLTPGLDATQILEGFDGGRTTRFEAPRPQDRPPMPPDWREPPRHLRAPLDGTSTRLFGLRATPLVGRLEERDILWSILSEVAAGESRTVVLRGSSGAGKSRLGQWLRVRAHELGVASVIHTAAGRILSPSQNPPGAAARHVMLTGLDGAELERRLDELHAELGLDPRVGLLVVEAHRRLEEGVEDLPRGWVEACARLLRVSAKGRPLIVSVDDLHWASLWAEFFERAPIELPGVLFLATVQNEALAQRSEVAARIAATVEARGARVLDVAELEVSECHELVADLLRLEPILAQRIARRAGGNPLFATQLVGDWVSRGWLVARSDGWRLRDGVDPPLPDSLHEVWQARLSKLLGASPPEHREALEIAAVLGKTVEGPQWHDALGRGGLPESGDLVEALVLDGLASRCDEGWAFAHDMLRESVLRDAREQGRYESTNALVAATLSETLPHSAIAAARVGRHLFESGQFARALQPLILGAQALCRANDLGGAMELLEMRKDAAEACAADPVELWRGELLRAQVLQQARQMQVGLEVACHVLEEATGLGAAPLMAEAHALLARFYNALGEPSRTLDHAEHALSLSQQLGDKAGIADAHVRLADYYSYGAELARSRAHYLAAADAAVGSGNGFSRAWASWGIGFVDYQLGQLDEAREHLERSIAEFREIGDMYYAHIVTGTLADLERVRGNFDDAEALYDRAESFLFVAVAPPPSVAVNRALLELMRGRFAAARVRAAGARTGTEREPAPNILLALLAIEACLAAHDEDFETWRELMDRMPPLADAINVVEYDFVWAYDQSLREGAGRFPDDAVLERLEIAARFWRRLSRSAEAESIAELARRL